MEIVVRLFGPFAQQLDRCQEDDPGGFHHQQTATGSRSSLAARGSRCGAALLRHRTLRPRRTLLTYAKYDVYNPVAPPMLRGIGEQLVRRFGLRVLSAGHSRGRVAPADARFSIRWPRRTVKRR